MNGDNSRFTDRLSNAFNRYRHRVGIGASIILGLIFLASGVGKIMDPGDSLARLLTNSPLPFSLNVFIANVLPWTELGIGLCLIAGIAVRIVSGGSFLLIIGFIYQNARLIAGGATADDCGCFGGLAELVESDRQFVLSSWTALYMDIGMLVLSLIIFFCYTGKLFVIVPWHLSRRKNNAA